MGIFCRLGKHRPIPSHRWNDGYYFSRCGACGADLIRRRSKWRPVPKGMKVVWRERQAWETDWNRVERPAAGEAAGRAGS